MAEISINVQIANRNYPLKIDSSEEDKVRVAVQLINDNIDKLKGGYVVTDYVDLLAMSALEIAMGSDDLGKVKEGAWKKKLDKDLLAIEKLVDDTLNSGESS